MPEKMKKKKIIRIVAIVVVIAVFLTWMVQRNMKNKMADMQNMISLSQTEEITKRSLTRSVGATGTIVSIESVDLSASLSGIEVQQLNVKVGDSVAAGDELVIFDTSEIEKNLEGAENSLSIAQQRNSLSASDAQRNVNDAERTKEYQIVNAQTNINTAYENFEDAISSYNKGVSRLEELKSEENTAYENYSTAEDALAEAWEALNQAKQAAADAEAAYQVAAAAYDNKKERALAKAQEAREALNQAKQAAADAEAVYQEAQEAKAAYDEQQAKGQEDTVSGGESSRDAEAALEALEEAERSNTAAQSALADAQNNYNVAQSNVAAAESGQEALKEAERSNTAAQSALADAQNNYNVAQSNVTAAENAYNSAKSSREAQEDTVDNLWKQVGSMQSSYDSTEKSYYNTVASQESSVASARSSQKSTMLNLSTENEEKQVEQYKEQIQKGVLMAPLSGIVTAVNYEEGDTYAQGTIITIQDCSSYEVEAEIGEYDISDIEVGQTVLIKTKATGDEELQGTIIFVSPTATQGSMGGEVTYQVRIAINTPSDRLRLDMSASLSIIIEQHENVLTVPYAAVLTDEDGNSYIQQVSDDGMTTTDVPVTVVMESNYYTEITSEGIHEGMKILVQKSEGNNSIFDFMGPGGGF